MKLLKFIFLINLLQSVKCHRKNVCKNYISYFFIENSSLCYYHPDLNLETTQIIQNHFGKSDLHKIITEDGYILTAYRLPVNKPKAIVVLQHPLTSDSSIFVGHSAESLGKLKFNNNRINLYSATAFLLVKEGYEVWLPNNRGTPTSLDHVELSNSLNKYWDFSFHEIGIYDYSAILNYISSQTNRTDLIFVGHSMSSTASLVYASLKPQEAKNLVKVFIDMSPVSTMKYSKNSLNFGVGLLLALSQRLPKSVIKGEDILPYFGKLAKFIANTPYKKIIVYPISLLFGWTPENTDPEYVNFLMKHNFKSHSIKIWYHYAQLLLNGDGIFQMYDYGQKTNLKYYNSTMPPEYPLGDIQVPVHLICSDMDMTTSMKDCEILYDKLSPQSKIYGIHQVNGFNHIDFFYGKQRTELVFSYVVNFIEKRIMSS